MDEPTKTCIRCKQTKLISLFNKDSKTKDKLTAMCKDCKKERMASLKKGGLPAKKIMRRAKVLTLARRMLDGMPQAQAYNSLGTTKNKAVASHSANKFLNSLDEDELALFRKMLAPPEILNGVRDFFSDVLTRKIDSTISEFNSTLNIWGKFAGTYAPEKSETITTTMARETTMSTLEKVAHMLKEHDNKEEEK